MRKWMEKGCPEIEHTPAQELIDREELKQLRAELDKYKTERDTLRAKIEAMEKQEPVGYMPLATKAALEAGGTGVVWNFRDRGIADEPLYALPGAQPAPSVPECPYPCGWRNLLKFAIEDGAYLARSIKEDEPVTENAWAATMRTVMRLRDVLMAINNAAPEAKP